MGGVGGSNGAVSGVITFNRYVREYNVQGVIRLVTQSKVFLVYIVTWCMRDNG